jgi:opacity protein-like surface antigen
MIRSTAVVATAALLAFAVPVKAQNTSGIFLGAQATGSDLHFGSAAQKVDFGGGWGVRAGFGLDDHWSLVGNYDRSSLPATGASSNFDVGSWDALARYSFMDGSMFRPYLTAGVTGRALKSSSFNGAAGDYSFSGTSPSAGLGAQWFVSQAVALDAGANWTFGNFSSVKTNGTDLGQKLDATGTRVMVGVAVYPFGHWR